MIINDNSFYRYEDLIDLREQEKLRGILDNEISTSPALDVPQYQTYPYLHTHYDVELGPFLQKVTECMKNLIPTIGLHNISKCWGNVCTENSNFGTHTHESDYTCIYYLRNRYPEYGTTIYDHMILKGVQNSLIIMKSKIPHSITNMPPHLAKDNHRYSIVVDYTLSTSDLLQQGFKEEQENV